MPSAPASPFIPPLPDMPGSSPVRPAVIPPFSPPQQAPSNPNHLSPYATPYAYPMPFPPPAGGMPPPTPGGPPPAPPPTSGRGFSSDYVGYGHSTPSNAPASIPPGAPPGATPYAPPGAVPGSTPYPGGAAQFYAPPPAPGAQWGGMPGWPGWGYAPPGGQAYPPQAGQAYPPPPAAYPGPPTGQTYPVPLPGQPAYAYQPPPAVPMYWPPHAMHGQPTPVPGYPPPNMYGAPHAPPRDAGPALARNDRFDIVFSFGEGSAYGPVLSPRQVQALGARLKVNPLLKPVEETDKEDQKHLVWNMLFSSGDVHLSSDAIHRSWSAGRDEPATFPRVSALRLLSAGFPWEVPVTASRPAAGVTCGDLIDQLCGFLHVRLRKDDYATAGSEQQRMLKNIYHYNRSRADGVPGGRLGEGLKRIDWLNTATMFGGARVNDMFAVQKDGIALPCTLEVLCLEREEGPEPDVEELRRRGRSRSRRASRGSSAHASTPHTPVTPLS